MVQNKLKAMKTGQLSDDYTLKKNLFAFAKPQNFHVFTTSVSYYKEKCDLRRANGFVITTTPLGFFLTKQVNDFLLRV